MQQASHGHPEKKRQLGHAGSALGNARPESLHSIANGSHLCFLLCCTLFPASLCSPDFSAHLGFFFSIVWPVLMLTSVLPLQNFSSPIPITIQLRISMSQFHIPSSETLIGAAGLYAGSHLNRCGAPIQLADASLCGSQMGQAWSVSFPF